MRISNERGDPALAHRPSAPARNPRIWSALEYACHVRDVFLVQRERLYLTLVEELPELRPDAPRRAGGPRPLRRRRPRRGRPRDSRWPPSMLAWAFEGLDETQWQRRCIYNFPERGRADRALARRATAVHEGEHHLHDVDAALRSAAAAVRSSSAMHRPPLALRCLESGARRRLGPSGSDELAPAARLRLEALDDGRSA